MTTITITISGAPHSVEATPEQVAALGAARVTYNERVTELDAGKPEDEKRPVFTDSTEFLKEQVLDRLAQFPEEVPADIMARFLASVAGTPVPEVVVPELSDDEKKARLLAKAAEKRWQVEVGGTTWNGHGVATDRASQPKLLAEFVAIGAGLRTDPSPWKFKDGFVSVSTADMAQVVVAARTHVASCFAVEGQLEADIIAGSVTEDADINAAPWPANA